MIINPYLKRRLFYFILLLREGRVVHWEDAEWPGGTEMCHRMMGVKGRRMASPAQPQPDQDTTAGRCQGRSRAQRIRNATQAPED